MGPLQESAYAKINLALHVRRRREDGYHELETLFAFCQDGDVLSAEAADDISLTIDGPFAAGLETCDGNLVIRAAKALQAAALRVLGQLWDVDMSVSSLALTLGADVPACVTSQSARGEGVGEALTPLGDALAGIAVLLVNPRVGVSTGAIFKAWDQVDHGPLAQGDDLLALAQSARNDLTAPAIALAPVIPDVLAALEAQPGTTLVRMSGSGATCFALFEDLAARDQAHAAIAKSHPNWWTMTSRLR